MSPSIEKRFPKTKAHAFWAETPEKDWNNWIWQQQKRIKTLETLKKILPLQAHEEEEIRSTEQSFRFAISPYYASLIDPLNPECPIRLQCVPSGAELKITPYEQIDPLAEERDMPVAGITHRYPDRVLFYTTHNCPVYCRHCMRKRKVADPSSAASSLQLEMGFRYIEEHPEIRDVLLSGGDPLSFSDERIEGFLARLRSIPHVELIRLGTRNLVTLPQRVTQALAERLRSYQPIYIHTHFNHPRECSREAYEACRLLVEAGCVLQNQSVLLKGINDSTATLRELNHKLLLMRVRPYYLHQCDQVEGLSHFRTPLQKGIQIIDELRGWTSGMAVPHFAIDLPGGGGKITLVPNYLVESKPQAGEPEKKTIKNKKLFFRNFRGEVFEYSDC